MTNTGILDSKCPLVPNWGTLVWERSVKVDCDRLGCYWCPKGRPGRMHSGAECHKATLAEALSAGSTGESNIERAK